MSPNIWGPRRPPSLILQDARFEAGAGEGALDEAVIASGGFDGDEAVAEVVIGEGLADLGDGSVEVDAVVGDGGGRDEDGAIEVGEEELGACLGAVEAEDAEAFGTQLLAARMKDVTRLADAVGGGVSARSPSGLRSGHEKNLPKRVWFVPFSQLTRNTGLFWDKTHIPGGIVDY